MGKIDRINAEIEKWREKASAAKARLNELERQKTDIENAEYMAVIKNARMTPQALAALIQSSRAQGGGATASSASASADDETETQEDNISED